MARGARCHASTGGDSGNRRDGGGEAGTAATCPRTKAAPRRAALTLAVALFAPRAFAAEPIDDSLVDIEDEALGPRGNLRTRAESVSFDAREKTLELRGNVRVDAPPFHLRSEHIVLTRTRYGIEVDGKGRLAFCPCLGTPLTIEFDEAIVAPPGELLLKNPKLEVYGVPVMMLPWFWLRGSEKVGVLPPDIAYRGQDGLFVGDGVHVPWKDRGAHQALDVRAGAYVNGGFAADARLQSPSSVARIRYDRLAGAHAPVLQEGGGSADDGLAVDARGRAGGVLARVAWDVDVLRGRRGVVQTSDVEAAARPWDRAVTEASIDVGPVIAASGFRGVSRRGGGLDALDASGPFVALRTSGAIASNAGSRLSYDVGTEGGSLRAVSIGSLSYARGESGLSASTAVGPLYASADARGAIDVVAAPTDDGTDRAGALRVRVAAPLVRAFESSEANDPFVHMIEPFASSAIVHTEGSGLLGTRPGRGLVALSGTVPVSDAGVRTTVGRWGRRDAIALDVAGGATHGDDPRALGRARLALSSRFIGARGDTAHVLGDGAMVHGRVRVGPSEGPQVSAHVLALGGLDPLLARVLSDAALEAPSGFVSRAATTGGTSLLVPWSRAVTTSGGVDVDLTSGELVLARAGVTFRDRCQCLAVRANGSHRVGREGVDVWVVIDFASDR